MGNSWAVMPYGADSAFINAFNSPNANAYAMLQQYQKKLAEFQNAAANDTTKTAASTDGTVNSPVVGVDPTFKGAPESGGVGLGTVALGTGISVGALATIAAYKKRDGKGMAHGFKMVYQGVKNFFGIGSKAASEAAAGTSSSKVLSLIKDGGKNLTEYTVKKDGLSVVMKDGKPIKLITEDSTEISNVKKWLKANSSAQTKVNGLSIPATGKLPDGVKFTNIVREVSVGGKKYKAVLDKKGNLVEVWDPSGNKVSNLEDFLNKHTKFAEDAETFSHKFTSKKVRLLNSSGNVYEDTIDITPYIRNGELIKATRIKGGKVTYLNEEELAMLKEDLKDNLAKIGRRDGVGLKAEECMYTYTGDITSGGKNLKAKLRFNGGSTRKIDQVTTTTEKVRTTKSEIDKYLENNGSVKAELDEITSKGILSEGYKLGNASYTANSGNLYTIDGNKIKSIKIKEAITIKGKKGKADKTFSAGSILTGNDIDIWQRANAVNGNEFDAIKNMLNK